MHVCKEQNSLTSGYYLLRQQTWSLDRRAEPGRRRSRPSKKDCPGPLEALKRASPFTFCIGPCSKVSGPFGDRTCYFETSEGYSTRDWIPSTTRIIYPAEIQVCLQPFSPRNGNPGMVPVVSSHCKSAFRKFRGHRLPFSPTRSKQGPCVLLEAKGRCYPAGAACALARRSCGGSFHRDLVKATLPHGGGNAPATQRPKALQMDDQCLFHGPIRSAA